MREEIKRLLDTACENYDKGTPFMTDAVFDELAGVYGYTEYAPTEYSAKGMHEYPMYSLQKVFDNEPFPTRFKNNKTIESPKLDGAAVGLTYVDGYLVRGLTRGDGSVGEDITEKMYALAPYYIPYTDTVQITGEVVGDKEIPNSRNFVAGALHQKDVEVFRQKINEGSIRFIAYGVFPFLDLDYLRDILRLKQAKFHTILDKSMLKIYPTDGTVFRINDNKVYHELGFTAKHPRGSIALKKTSDVEIKETTLTDVVWQVGSSGKVTPVAEFDEVILDDAKVSRATLHNKGFIEDMDLDIGDTILVCRSGGVIPKIVGKL